MIGQRPCRRMRKHDWRLRDIQDIIHRSRRDMRQIDNHAHTIHFPNNFFAESRKPFVPHCIGRRIRPVVAIKMRQRHVTNTEAVVASQRTQ